MKIQLNTIKEATDLIYEILNQGDSRYNDPKGERELSLFLINQAVLLEEREIQNMQKPRQKSIPEHYIQGEEKYIVKSLLNLQGFNDNEIFYEISFRSSRPDVLAEKEDKIIIAECCSCKISKIIDFLSEAEEVWILTRGEPPWEEKLFFEKMQWFIFKKGPYWNKFYTRLIQKQTEELKKIPSPIDNM